MIGRMLTPHHAILSAVSQFRGDELQSVVVLAKCQEPGCDLEPYIVAEIPDWLASECIAAPVWYRELQEYLMRVVEEQGLKSDDPIAAARDFLHVSQLDQIASGIASMMTSPNERRAEVLREVEREMNRTDENWSESGHPSMEDYVSDVARRFNTMSDIASASDGCH